MEKINVAELLCDCPSGMELDCTLYENVEFEYVDPNPELAYPIHCLTKTNNGGYNVLVFTRNGCNDRHPNAKCVIFPKGKTTWEGFHRPFKDGEVVVCDSGDNLQLFIFKNKKENSTLSCCYLMLNGDELDLEEGMYYVTRLATEEEKEKLFKAIKDNGYKWNEEKKILEKLIESKEDINDEVVMSGIYFDKEYYADEVELYLNNYEIEIRDGKTYAVFKNQETKISKPSKMKEAKDLKLGDKIYALNPRDNTVHILFVDDILECMSDSNLLKIKYKNDYMKGEFKIYNNNKSYFNDIYCFYLDKNKVISELNDNIKYIQKTINIIKDN